MRTEPTITFTKIDNSDRVLRIPADPHGPAEDPHGQRHDTKDIFGIFRSNPGKTSAKGSAHLNVHYDYGKTNLRIPADPFSYPYVRAGARTRAHARARDADKSRKGSAGIRTSHFFELNSDTWTCGSFGFRQQRKSHPSDRNDTGKWLRILCEGQGSAGIRKPTS